MIKWGCDHIMYFMTFLHFSNKVLVLLDLVGYFNYRYFVNFMLYVLVGMLYGAVISYEPFRWLQSQEYRDFARKERVLQVHLDRPFPMMPHREEKLEISLAFMLCLAVGAALLLLGGFHVFLVLTGQTTIEFHGNWNNWRRAREQGTPYKNPYDQGWKRNWHQVFGTHCWLWAMLPSRRPPEFLPFPVPGKNTQRKMDRKGHESKDDEDYPQAEVNGIGVV
jgi:palmitoyltransferase